jgi:hypothetical protein
MTRALLVAFVTISTFASIVTAVPVTFETRQIGNLACNIARVKTVAGLAATSAALKGVPTASDATVATAVTTAKDGLQSASAGIKTIAGALLTGQSAPAAARDDVAAGLTQAQTALQGISATDAATSKAVGNALSKLQNTIDAGQDVVTKCGGGGAAAASASTASPATSGATQALSGRQIGGIKCNISRLQTVTALGASTAAVAAVEAASKGDAASSAAAKTAQAGLGSASAAITKIAEAIVTLQKAPPADRDQALQGLSDAQTAMGSITSTNKVVTAAVSGAQKLIANTITAANGVVANC